MELPDPPFLAEFNEQERIHFGTLSRIRSMLPSESQLQLVEGLSRSLRAPRLLTLIARTPHWLAQGPVLQALAENEHTPGAIRRDLEMAVSLFDLMRDLDRAHGEEKDEISRTVRSLYQQLPPGLKPIVKAISKQLARSVVPSGHTAELPPLPTDLQDWEALTAPPVMEEPLVVQPPAVPRAELLERAKGTHQVDELCSLLVDADGEIRQAALKNPLISEDLLQSVLPACPVPELFEEVYAEARWYFREAIRNAILEAPASPQGLTRKIGIAHHLVGLLAQGSRDIRALRRITSLFSQLDESEFQFVTFWAKRENPNLLRVIKYFYDRLQRRRASQASGMPSHPGEGRWASLEERVFLANQANQPEQFIASLNDPDPQVFMVVLENPALTPRELLAAIPGMDRFRAEKLANHHAWGENPAIQEALLHNPHLGESTALRLLVPLSSTRPLLDLLRDARITHLELKRQALEKLRALYLGMDSQHRIVTLRATGGELIRHLPQEVLQDVDTLRTMVSDRQLDPSILLRLARNKQTHRSILEQIAVHPILLAHPAIMQELLLNPKTPRESAIRIWGLLSESEQQLLLRSPHLPAPLRNLAGSV
ncbi:MAG: hypothetical protein HY823_08350 [Acidobacteria bacterium]|nr:hypothetical protein [Acidobacteriota bacterium]